MSELTELVRRLVSTPSHRDETDVGDIIEAWLREAPGVAVTRDETGNIFAQTEPETDSETPTFALVGHHDVVPPADSQVVGTVDDPDRCVVDERDGRVYGRGTADMKGALAACMIAFRDADPDCRLLFASFTGEEVGGEGARAAIARGFDPEYALVAEGSTNYSAASVTDIVVAHKGRRASTLIAEGQTAHASNPETGTNAVYRASDAIDIIRNLQTPTTMVQGTRLSGSVVITEISGGEAWNVVPDRCVITVDERTVPGDRAAVGDAAMIDGVVHTVDQDLPPMACSDGHFANTALTVASDVQAGQPAHVTKPHATDAGWLADAGTATIVCGPAEPGEAHTDTESVSVDVLHRCERLYRRLAERVSATHR